MSIEIYSFKPSTSDFSLKQITSLIQEGLQLHLKDLQRLRDNAEEQKIVARKFEKSLKKHRAPPPSSPEKGKPQERGKAKKLPPLFKSSAKRIESESLISVWFLVGNFLWGYKMSSRKESNTWLSMYVIIHISLFLSNKNSMYFFLKFLECFILLFVELVAYFNFHYFNNFFC